MAFSRPRRGPKELPPGLGWEGWEAHSATTDLQGTCVRPSQVDGESATINHSSRYFKGIAKRRGAA